MDNIIASPCMRVALRPTSRRDIDFILASEKHEKNAPFLRQWSVEEHEAALLDPNIGHFVVETIQDHQPVGYVVLAGIRNSDFCLELRRMVIAMKGFGYCRETLRLILAHAFDKLTFHRIWLDVVPYNKRVYKLFKAEGFTVEGTHRQAVRHETGFMDVKVMSLLRGEYYARFYYRPVRFVDGAVDVLAQCGEQGIR